MTKEITRCCKTCRFYEYGWSEDTSPYPVEPPDEWEYCRKHEQATEPENVCDQWEKCGERKVEWKRLTYGYEATVTQE